MKKIENDLKGNPRVSFTGKLLSVSANVLQNVNGTSYRVANIEFADNDSVIQKSSGLMYEKNYAHGVIVGKEYLCTATLTSQGAIVAVSHLEAGADRPSADMFFSDEEIQSVITNVQADGKGETVKEKGTLVS